MNMQVNIGISEDNRQEIAKGLEKVLADSYTLYIKTHNFHWNVTGPMFQALHLLFETQYLELAQAVDTIAERIRALGYYAPGSYKQFSELTTIKEETGHPKATQMIEQLTIGQETIIRTCRELFSIADEAGDESTADLLTQRMEAHEKSAWMLRSLLE